MHLTILDPQVSDTMNGFLILANVINLIYNIPQMLRTYQTKSTKDFSTWFIFLRIIGNSIWIVYSINIDSLQMLINNCVTVFASIFISYYKVNELYAEYKYKHHQLLLENDETLLESCMYGEEQLQLEHKDNIILN